jgi:hypothetical protein
MAIGLAAFFETYQQTHQKKCITFVFQGTVAVKQQVQ